MICNDTDLSKETWKILSAFNFPDTFSSASLRGLDDNWITNFLSSLQKKQTSQNILCGEVILAYHKLIP